MSALSVRALVRGLAAGLLTAWLSAGAAQAATAPTSGKGSAPAATAPAPAPAPAPVGHGPAVQIYASPPPASACGGGLMLEPPPANVSAVKAVATLSAATQAYIRECACDTQQCIADALDQYAKALTVVAPRLPKPLRNLPRVVAEAAHRVRVARTQSGSGAAPSTMRSPLCSKDISLVRSEDVEVETSKQRSGELVAGTLNVASDALVNSGALGPTVAPLASSSTCSRVCRAHP